MKLRSLKWTGLFAIALVGACSDEGGHRSSVVPDPEEMPDPDPKPNPKPDPKPDPDVGGAGGDGGTGGAPPVINSLLRLALDCDDLSDALRAEVRARLAEGVTPELPGWGGSAGTGSGGAWTGSGGTFAAGGSGPVSGGSGGGSSSAGSSSSGGSDPVFTGTNTQIPGVDEPDFMKTDGQHFFIADGSTLRVAKGYPTAELELVASAPLPGFGNQIMLADGASEGERLIVVYSYVDGAQVLADAGVDGTAQMFTKLSVFRFASAELEVVAEYYFEGNYVSARRQAEDVRTLLTLARPLPELRTYPTEADRQKAELLVLERIQDSDKSVADYSSEEIDQLVNDAIGEVLLAENEEAIAAIDAKDFIPRAYHMKDGGLVDVSPDCGAFYVPEVGTMDLAVTFVPQVDLLALEQAPAGAALLGASQTMFENAEVTIIASPPDYSRGDDAETQLHVFEVGDEPLAYRASGVVPGVVDGQFSLSAQDGTVRVVTSTADRSNHLYTLQADGEALAVVGDAGDFGADEDVQAVRFAGDRGYVVTFRQTDPLFVFDLSDPTMPELLGELEIPGFSEYMHPIDDTHLLTIGQGENWNTVLRLFDVSDPTAPEAVFLHDFDYNLTTEASIDHRAFTYFADRNLLAVPFAGYDWWNYQSYSQIALVRVSTSEGFSQLGSLDGAILTSELAASSPTCDYWTVGESARLQRGTFIENTLYGVASSGIVAAPVDAIDTLDGVLAFPQECEVWGGAGGTGGSVGTGGTGGAPNWGGEAGVGGDVGGTGPGSGGAGGAVSAGAGGAGPSGGSGGFGSVGSGGTG
jgi:hypothetical protein